MHNSLLIEQVCALGHKWSAKFKAIANGDSCPHCLPTPEEQLEKAKRFAVDNGGECLSEIYFTATAPLKWKCANGHDWSEDFNSILKRPTDWCRQCSQAAGKTRLRQGARSGEHFLEPRDSSGPPTKAYASFSIAKLKRTVASRGGNIYCGALGADIPGKTGVQITCSAGHGFSMDARKILDGAWCPDCRKAARFDKKSPMNRQPKKLVNSRGQKKKKIRVAMPYKRAPKETYHLPRNYGAVGLYLKRLRLKAGLKQKVVSLAIGYSSSQFISNIECGIYLPPLKKLKNLADLYGADIERLCNLVSLAERKIMMRVLRGQ